MRSMVLRGQTSVSTPSRLDVSMRLPVSIFQFAFEGPHDTVMVRAAHHHDGENLRVLLLLRVNQMSVTLLAASAIAVLGPYVAKAAEAMAGKVGEHALEKGEALLSSLWARWRGKPASEAILSEFVKDPVSGKANLQAELAVDLATDSQFQQAMQALIDGGSPQAFQQQTVRDAAIVTGPEIMRLVRGSATQVQDVTNAGAVVGPKIGTIGE